MANRRGENDNRVMFFSHKLLPRWVPWIAGAALALSGCSDGGEADNDGGEGGAGGAPPSSQYPRDNTLRINQLQVKGTHNSYHVELPDNVIPNWMYTRDPLDVQTGEQGVRALELDTSYADGEIRVFHVPTLDDGTVCETLEICLQQLKQWSDANPGHHLLFVQIEPKDEEFSGMPPFGTYGDRIDEVILSVWPRERVLAPDDVQGSASTLNEAVTVNGWPTLGEGRDKILFFLDDDGMFRDTYSADGTSVAGRLIFPDFGTDHPLAAFTIMNEPMEDPIDDAARAGLMVRTRADKLDVANLTERRPAALATGAHILTTDYPVSADGIEAFDIVDGAPSRCNPITAPADCTSADIEELQ